MGSIKNSTQPQEHELNEEEFNYVLNINQAKNNIVGEYNRVISAFLKYIASSRLGYAPAEDLQFEVDFSDKKRTLKITVLPKEN